VIVLGVLAALAVLGALYVAVILWWFGAER